MGWWYTIKERCFEWYYFKRKEFILWQETRRRGGKETRGAKRKERQGEIKEVKEAIYSDLQNGWMVGDFRIQVEHAEVLERDRGTTPLKELEEIYFYYRTMQNEIIRR
jgi:hypothetical protein